VGRRCGNDMTSMESPSFVAASGLRGLLVDFWRGFGSAILGAFL
jgi:hypothetical protein